MDNLPNHSMGNLILALSVMAWAIAQILKVVVVLVRKHRLDFRNILSSGGMPSSHSALVCGVAMATAKKLGYASPEFALALALAGIVMYDAMGVRYETGEQAKVLNRMFTEWMDQGFEQFQLPHGKKLKEMVGHTPIEVVTGAALGIVLGFAMPMV